MGRTNKQYMERLFYKINCPICALLNAYFKIITYFFSKQGFSQQ